MTTTDIPPEAITALVKADLSQPRPWDGPPELLLIYRHTFGLAMAPVPLPPIIWEQAGHPVHVVRSLVRAGIERPRHLTALMKATEVPGAGLMIGLALRCEAWMGMDMSAEEAARVDAGELFIRDLPGRFEVRFTSAVDVVGRTYMASLKRGQEDIDAGYTGDPDGDSRAAGRVPEAIQACFRAMLKAQGAAYS